MKQGEIWQIDLNPVKGSEQAGRRPVVIISGNLLNKYLDVVIVCPLTSSIKHYKGNVVLHPNPKNKLKVISEVLTFHVRSVSKDRLHQKVGHIETEELNIIKQGLVDILNY